MGQYDEVLEDEHMSHRPGVPLAQVAVRGQVTNVSNQAVANQCRELVVVVANDQGWLVACGLVWERLIHAKKSEKTGQSNEASWVSIA